MIIIGLDVETSKVPRHRPWMPGSFLVSVGLVDGDGTEKSWVLHHDHVPSFDKDQIASEVQSEIDKADLIVGHNLKFDLQWMYHLGVDTDRCKVHCTQVGEYLIRGQDKSLSYSLRDSTLRHGLEPKDDRVKMFWEEGYETSSIPLDVLVPYMLTDTRITREMYFKQAGILANKGMDKLMLLQNELMRLLSHMEYDGCRFDKERAQQLLLEYTKQIKDTEEQLHIELQDDGVGINFGSNDELSAALYGGVVKRPREIPYVATRNTTLREPYVFQYKDSAKTPVTKMKSRVVRELVVKRKVVVDEITLPRIFTPIERTEVKKYGYWKVDKNTIGQLKAKTRSQKLIKQLLDDHSKFGKVAETLQGNKEDAGLIGKVMANGIIHPSFNQTVTATGRLSSSNPNGQNLPRGNTSPIKECFVPRYDLIGNADLSQLEWRVVAFLSQDRVAMEEIVHNLDYHRDNAIKFFSADPGLENDHPKFKPKRTVAKTFGFRMVYGGSPFGFHLDKNMPPLGLKRWKEVVEEYWDKYSGIKQWQDRNIDLVHKQGYLVNPSGRVLSFRRFVECDREGHMYNIRSIKNYPVQSFATADITPLAMLVIRKKMKDAGCRSLMILQVHDSIVFDLVKSEVDTIAKISVDTFGNLPSLIKKYWGVNFNVPLGGEFEAGPNYRELKRIL